MRVGCVSSGAVRGFKKMSSSSQMERVRPLVIDIFKVPRDLGSLPTTIHSDVRTTVIGLIRAANQRGKPVTLPPERAAAVDAALRQAGAYPGGVAALAVQISTWRREFRADVSAEGINAYYDQWRAEGYTQALSGAQEVLTQRCAELAGLPQRGSLVLDLGCGSGLSMLPLRGQVGAMLGIDASFEMLKQARRAGHEVVQADVSRPLPLRPGCLDACISVSALQFLCEPAAGQSADERLRGCFGEVRRVLASPAPPPPAPPPPAPPLAPPMPPLPQPLPPPCISVQFHPADEASHPHMMVAAAREAMGGTAVLVVDQPHRTSARRWLLIACPLSDRAGGDAASSDGARDPKCCTTSGKNLARALELPACCAMHAPRDAACLLTLQSWAQRRAISCVPQLPVPRIDAAHLEWLYCEHVRYAHKALRTLRRVEAEQSVCPPAVAPSSVSATQGGEKAAADASVVLDASIATVGAVASNSPAPARKNNKRKDKGFLAPTNAAGGEAHPSQARPTPMSDAERRVVMELRKALGIEPGTCPSIEEVQAKRSEVLAVLHGAIV